MELILNNNFETLEMNELENIDGAGGWAVVVGVLAGSIIVANAPVLGGLALGYGAWAAGAAAFGAAASGAAIIDESLKWR